MQLLIRFLCRRVFLLWWAGILFIVVSCLATPGVIYAADPGVIDAASGAANFSLQPVIFDPKNPLTKVYFIFNINSPTNATDSVRVLNAGNALGTVNIYAVDAVTSSTGDISYQGQTAPRHEVGSWVRLSRLRLTLGSGQNQDVPFKLTIPRNIGSGQHIGGIVAESVSAQNAKSKKIGITLHVKKLYVIPIVVNITGKPVEKLSVSGVRLDVVAPYERIVIGLSNAGNMMLKPTGTLTVTNRVKSVVLNMKLKFSGFLPHSTIQFPINIVKKAFSVGTYKARVVLAYGKYIKGKLDTTFSFQVKKVGKPLVLSVSQVTQGPDTIFSSLTLTPWHYAFGGTILLLAGSAIFFWMQKLYLLVVNFRRKN